MVYFFLQKISQSVTTCSWADFLRNKQYNCSVTTAVRLWERTRFYWLFAGPGYPSLQCTTCPRPLCTCQHRSRILVKNCFLWLNFSLIKSVMWNILGIIKQSGACNMSFSNCTSHIRDMSPDNLRLLSPPWESVTFLARCDKNENLIVHGNKQHLARAQ
jgi:hypothetical protein